MNTQNLGDSEDTDGQAILIDALVAAAHASGHRERHKLAVYGMRDLGFACRRVTVPDIGAVRLSVSAMISVDLPMTGPESRAVAIMEASAERAEVRDPLWGRRVFTPKSWPGDGTASPTSVRTCGNRPVG